MHKPKKGKRQDADPVLGFGGGASPAGSAADALIKALEATSNPRLKADLQAEAQTVQESSKQAPPSAASTGEAHRRAEASWKEANRRHDQATEAVREAREQLTKAEEREAEAAQQLAEAEIAKRIAVRALAAEEGLATATGQSSEASQASQPGSASTFDVQWDVSFFESLHQGEFECEENEKSELLQLEQELLHAKTAIGERGEKVQA